MLDKLNSLEDMLQMLHMSDREDGTDSRIGNVWER